MKRILKALFRLLPLPASWKAGIGRAHRSQTPMSVYKKWLKYNTPTEEHLKEQRTHTFPYMPLVSIVVPLYNTPLTFFKEMVHSVREQTYAQWELCLADGSETENPAFREFCSTDKRIRYTFIGQNKGIAGNSNAAAALAMGDYIALLDHDDVLPPHALFKMVKTANENRDADFFYSDEDKCMTGKNGKLIRFDPHFKPDFAPDALNSNNYICHFSMLKKALFKNLGGFHSGYDGAQDHDLFLRASEKTDKFVHIPDVLYHWRVHAGSTAGAAAAKEYAAAAGVKAVQNHLDRLGLPGHVTKDRYGTYDVRYAVTGNPSVTILIPRNSLPALKRCIDSLLTLTTYENYRIAVIENNSTDEQAVAYYGQLAQNPRIQILRCPEKDVNHAAMIHFGVHSTVSDFVLQLSNDTELLTPDWLQLMLGFAQRKGTGAVGVKLLYPDRTIQHAGIVLGVQGIAGYAHKGKNGDHPGYFCRAQTIQDVSAVTTACLMAKREVYERIDDRESALPPLLGDVDFCLKIRSLGERIVYLPTVELLHYDSKSGDADDAAEQIKRFPRETRRFLDKWGAALDKGDPYYNPNLSLANSDFRITPHPAVRFPLCLPKE